MNIQTENINGAVSYTSGFYEWQQSNSYKSAQYILPILLQHFKPNSAIDVGCGVQTWLKSLTELGVEDVLGVDGDWVPKDQLLLSTSQFQPINLNSPRLSLERSFDLAISLEVAEHLKPESAIKFVKFLCAHSDVILFSAAIPGQGGRYHINEQWPSYWAKIFLENGFKAYDFIRPDIWANKDIAWWYRNNIIVFSKSTLFPSQKKPEDLNIVHPDHYTDMYNKLTLPKLSYLIKSIPKSIAHDVKRKILKKIL